MSAITRMKRLGFSAVLIAALTQCSPPQGGESVPKRQDVSQPVKVTPAPTPQPGTLACERVTADLGLPSAAKVTNHGAKSIYVLYGYVEAVLWGDRPDDRSVIVFKVKAETPTGGTLVSPQVVSGWRYCRARVVYTIRPEEVFDAYAR